jgi:hypothetical protein
LPEAVVMNELVSTIPSARMGTVADAFCFLANERATYVNGSALVVDGNKSLVISKWRALCGSRTAETALLAASEPGRKMS